MTETHTKSTETGAKSAVTRAKASSDHGRRPWGLTRYHATAFLGPPDDAGLEDLRSRWDPVMASQIAAHITLLYPHR
jgi:hypothetical protein